MTLLSHNLDLADVCVNQQTFSSFCEASIRPPTCQITTLSALQRLKVTMYFDQQHPESQAIIFFF